MKKIVLLGLILILFCSACGAEAEGDEQAASQEIQGASQEVSQEQAQEQVLEVATAEEVSEEPSVENSSSSEQEAEPEISEEVAEEPSAETYRSDTLDRLSSNFEQIEEALEKYRTAMSGTEKDTHFRYYAGAYETINEEFEDGFTNSNTFWATAEFLFGTELLEEWEWSVDKIYEATGDVVDVFSDANSAGYGLIERLYELSQAGELVNDEGEQLMEISKDADGAYTFDVDNEDFSEIAKRVGIAEEAMLACFEAIGVYGEIYGMNVYDLTDIVAAVGTNKLSVMLGNLEVFNFNSLKECLDRYGKTQKEIHDIREEFAFMDGVCLFDITSDSEEFVQSLIGMGLATEDGETISVDYQGMLALMVELGYTRDDAENVSQMLLEIEGVTLDSDGVEIGAQDALSLIEEFDWEEE